MIEIIPSLLVKSKKEFEKKLRLVENDVETIHVDILDGSLFDNTSWFNALDVGAMRTKVKYELHLMVENPLPIIRDWKKHVIQTKRAIIQAEIERQLGAVIDVIHDELHLEAGISLNPETPLDEIHHMLHQIEHLTIMGIHPGLSGQPFLGEQIIEKIKCAHAHVPELPIEIDGGVTKENLKELTSVGITRICTASLLFHSGDVLSILNQIKHDIL
ncbi:MAG: hypothetical protein ABIH21_00870 [Patescibacteria group bacterium]